MSLSILVPVVGQAMEPDLFNEVSRNCEKLHGENVTLLPRYNRNPELLDLSRAKEESVIYVNESLLAKLPPYVIEFELYSACGRWGVLERVEPDQTHDSDCWAVQSMIRIGRWSRKDVQRVIDWYFEQGAVRDFVKSKPTPIERAKRMYSCSR